MDNKFVASYLLSPVFCRNVPLCDSFNCQDDVNEVRFVVRHLLCRIIETVILKCFCQQSVWQVISFYAKDYEILTAAIVISPIIKHASYGDCT